MRGQVKGHTDPEREVKECNQHSIHVDSRLVELTGIGVETEGTLEKSLQIPARTWPRRPDKRTGDNEGQGLFNRIVCIDVLCEPQYDF